MKVYEGSEYQHTPGKNKLKNGAGGGDFKYLPFLFPQNKKPSSPPLDHPTVKPLK